ncbi:glycosyltransferase [Bdellovibrio sp. HCB288]|uniref:glycosyltransferase n=1 Tax=Bdellovibrio sp. HCB288 TaxID=3394355 RepID=UPI0039B41E25
MSERKHIVFVTEHLTFGGAEVVLTTYLKTIDPKLYQVSLIIRDDLGEKNYLLKEVPSHINVYTLFNEADGKLRCNKAELRKRFRASFAKLGNVDVVVDFSPVLDKIIHRLKIKKSILWMHGDKSHMGFCERLKYRLRIRNYDKIVLLCDEMREQFSGLFPELKNKFVVIANPFVIEDVKAKSLNEAELSELDREMMKKKFIVSVARLVPGKDFQTVIEAARILKCKGYSYRHYIIGDGELRGELQGLIDKYSLNDMVFLLGAKKNPYPWIFNSEFFVHSANREGFGLVIVEAMILRKAVIATKCPVGPDDILNHGEFGKLFGLNDATGLANHIASYLKDTDLRGHFERKAEKRAQYYSVDNILPLLYSAFDSE